MGSYSHAYVCDECGEVHYTRHEAEECCPDENESEDSLVGNAVVDKVLLTKLFEALRNHRPQAEIDKMLSDLIYQGLGRILT